MERKELIEQYVKEHQDVVERAKQDDLIIEPILQGNQYGVRVGMNIREKTAEEKLAEIKKEEK